MAYNEELTRRVRAALTGVRAVEEKRMFGGVAFMMQGVLFVIVTVVTAVVFRTHRKWVHYGG